MASPSSAEPSLSAESGSDGAVVKEGLTPEQLAFFHENGYLELENWLDAATIQTLKSATNQILSEFDASTISVFTTKEQTRTSDEYFLTSGDKVRCFVEEGALNAQGGLTLPKEEAINKIGHNLHELVPAFREVSFDPRVAAVCRSLGFKHPLVPQSMAILKKAFVGGEVKPHVDGAFLYTEPQSVCGFWWPLEDCTKQNGCLWAVPGSHKGGVHRVFRRGPPGGPATEFSPAEPDTFDLTGAVPLEMKAGGLVLLHSSLVHYSEANTSPLSRYAYSIHVVEGEGVTWSDRNWLQRDTPFPALY